MRIALSLFCLLTLMLSSTAQSASEVATEITRFYKSYTRAGAVDYAAISQNPEALRDLTNSIAHADVAVMKGNEKKAFLINAYNISVIDGVMKHYPVDSPMDIKGFFDSKRHVVGGEKYSLNELEKQVLYKLYPDERLHFALVCAARGCPPLYSRAFTAAGLEKQLDQVTATALKNNKFIRYDKEQNAVLLPKIFEWYMEDFGELGEYLFRKTGGRIPAGVEIDFYEYDWSLNQA